MSDHDELYTALLRERYAAPRLAPTHPVPAPSRGAGIPDQHQRAAYLLRLHGYGWTPAQIAAVTGVDEVYVTQVLARAGRTRASEEGVAA
ncbi:hypothetical protein [Micromonospora deserti]|uniref:Uncharacterized protein n=1 Tax=Micromonospora deserti TaxID=2070366 RepID=A0A2W2CKQ8_9ACTN|nr:hypothetical protein [Micromonospora deserti]PZF98530.1 hypothetical protein C1I99_13295 [Micromonospora deserti]